MMIVTEQTMVCYMRAAAEMFDECAIAAPELTRQYELQAAEARAIADALETGVEVIIRRD